MKEVVQHVNRFISRATLVFRILINDLKKRNISARGVPHCLTAEQREEGQDIAALLKERLDVEDRHATFEEFSRAMEFQQWQYSIFWLMIYIREKFLHDGFLTAWTAEQKQKYLGIAILLKEGFEVEVQAFFSRIVDIDEMLIRHFEPELKS